MKLTKAHVSALRIAKKNPFLGFPPFSNLWPLTVLDQEGSEPVDGEFIDELLREGLLSAEAINRPVQGERSDDHDFAPDLEFQHEIVITDLGRSALEASE